MLASQQSCVSASRQSYEARAALAQNPLGRRCLEIMARKRTNLAVAADVPTAAEMLALADQAWTL